MTTRHPHRLQLNNRVDSGSDIVPSVPEPDPDHRSMTPSPYLPRPTTKTPRIYTAGDTRLGMMLQACTISNHNPCPIEVSVFQNG